MIQQVFRSKLRIGMDQHSFGGLPLARMTGNCVAVVNMWKAMCSHRFQPQRPPSTFRRTAPFAPMLSMLASSRLATFQLLIRCCELNAISNGEDLLFGAIHRDAHLTTRIVGRLLPIAAHHREQVVLPIHSKHLGVLLARCLFSFDVHE